MEFQNQFCSVFHFIRSKHWETCPHYGVARTRRSFAIRMSLLWMTPELYAQDHSNILPDSFFMISSVQFSSVTQSCPTLWDPMNHSTPGLPVHHQLPESTQTHAHSWSAGVKSNNFFLNTAESKELETHYLATVICFFIFWKV